MSDDTPIGEEEPEGRGVGLGNKIPSAVKARIVSALATGMTLAGAADFANEGSPEGSPFVTRRMITYLNAEDPEFQEMLRQQEDDVRDAILDEGVAEAKRAMKDLLPLAREKLAKTLESDDPRVYMPAVRLVMTGTGTMDRPRPDPGGSSGMERDVTSTASPAEGD